MIKAVLKTIALLVIFFVMLVVGMKNTHEIDFNFPFTGPKVPMPIHATAAFVYFGIFAVGLLAGTILTVRSGAGKKSAGKEK